MANITCNSHMLEFSCIHVCLFFCIVFHLLLIWKTCFLNKPICICYRISFYSNYYGMERLKKIVSKLCCSELSRMAQLVEHWYMKQKSPDSTPSLDIFSSLNSLLQKLLLQSFPITVKINSAQKIIHL